MHILWWIVIFIVVSLATDKYLLTHGPQLAKRNKGNKPIVDLVHHYCPSLEGLYGFYNVLLVVFVAPLVFYIGRYPKRKFFPSLFRFMLILFTFRKITTIMTIHSPPNEMERNHGGFWSTTIWGSWDLSIAAGHVCFAIAMVFLMLEFNIISNRVWWGILLIAYGLFSTASRAHQTVDVVGAFLLVPLVYDFARDNSASKRLYFS